MPKEYDVKDVNIYITDVMKLSSLDRVRLWLILQGDMHDEAHRTMKRRFFRQNLAVQANILYRFGPIIEKVVGDQAKAKAQEARMEGAM